MRNQTKRNQNKLVLAFVAAALTCGVFVTPSNASAQAEVEITGPLANAPAVRHMRLYRKGRIQIQPMFSFTLQDQYTRTLQVGLQLHYHFTDWLGVGLFGHYGVVGLNTNLTDEIQQKGVTTDRNRLSLPNRDVFEDQIAQMQWNAGLQLDFIPLRGKLALFQKLFVDTDFHIFLGVAFVGLDERANVTAAAQADNDCLGGGGCTATTRESRVAIAPTFGAGLTMYFNDFLGLNLEWRGMPFSWNTSGTDEARDGSGDFPDGMIDENDRIFQFNHMFTVGLVIYLPTAVEITE